MAQFCPPKYNGLAAIKMRLFNEQRQVLLMPPCANVVSAASILSCLGT